MVCKPSELQQPALGAAASNQDAVKHRLPVKEGSVQRQRGRGCGMLHASVHFWLQYLSNSWERSPCALHHQNHLLELCLESPGPLEAAGRKRQREILLWKEVKKCIYIKLTLSSPSKAFATPTQLRHRLGWSHPSGARGCCGVPWGQPAACRVYRKCSGTNKRQCQQLLMRVGCEPVPDTALSSTAVSAPISSWAASVLRVHPTTWKPSKENSSGHPDLGSAVQGLHACNECRALAASSVGWVGDKPTAFNCGFMAADDPQLTLCLRGVWMQLWGLINGKSRDLSCHDYGRCAQH